MTPALRRAAVALAAVCSCLPAARAEVTLPHIFGSHMVLQRDRPLPVWGWAEPGEKVTVKLGELPAVETVAAADRTWSVRLPAQPAGGPLTLTVTGANTLTCEDVLLGEVWIASGQSNMQWSLNAVNNAAEEIAAANHPRLRQIAVPRVPQSAPVTDFTGAWQVAAPETVPSWTAVGYFFGRHLLRELDVPVGIINTSWGGTRIEPWTPPVGFGLVPELADLYQQVLSALPTSEVYRTKLDDYLKALDAWVADARAKLAANQLADPAPPFPAELTPPASRVNPQQQPTTLYNGMIHPFLPYALRGAIWYQGESNHGEGMLYAAKKEALIRGWRQLWGDPEMPFYFVQIAPYQYSNEAAHILPEFWVAQASVVDRVPHTGMAVINDVGNLQDIHPRNKQDVGLRLALIALAQTYQRPNIVWSGPVYKAHAAEGAALRVTFDHVGGGLTTRDGAAPDWFEIIGPGSDWTKATARIDGAAVVLTAEGVTAPTAVRFAWHKLAEPNLRNREGLPAGAFLAGDVPEIDYLQWRVPEAAGYELVYDLDLNNVGQTIRYSVDRHAEVKPFDRIGYFLELKKDGQVQYAWVSCDAFTADAGKIGLPTVTSGARFQQRVTRANVISNVPGIVTGEGLATCNIEFWPHNYGPQNSANIPGASAELWDFGDQPADPVDGYGCMQIHNWEAKQTIFAINQWKVGGGGVNLGIGNSTADQRTRDWTFVSNGGTYEAKRLRVLVRPRG